jgi:integrase
MPSIKPFIKNDFVKLTGKANIKIRVCHEGKTRFIATEWNIEPQYMKSDGTISSDYPNANKLNMSLNELLNEYYAVIDNIGLKIRHMTINSLLECLRNKDIATSFSKFAQARIEELKEQGRLSYAHSYEIMLIALSKFSTNLAFKDINIEFLQRFDLALKNSGCKTNTRKIYLSNIRAILNVATERGLINLPNPYRNFHIKQERTAKRSLSTTELRSLFSIEFSPTIQRSVDIFKLILYLNGINLKDLLYITPDRVYNGRIEVNRAKTGIPLSVKIFPEAMQIIERYKGNRYLLNIMEADDSYDAYNAFLRQTNVNLKKAYGGKIGTYHARHSLASLLSELDTPMETISQVLGHNLPGSAMTATYIKFNTSKVDEAMGKVIAYLNKESLSLSYGNERPLQGVRDLQSVG